MSKIGDPVPERERSLLDWLFGMPPRPNWKYFWAQQSMLDRSKHCIAMASIANAFGKHKEALAWHDLGQRVLDSDREDWFEDSPRWYKEAYKALP